MKKDKQTLRPASSAPLGRYVLCRLANKMWSGAKWAVLARMKMEGIKDFWLDGSLREGCPISGDYSVVGWIELPNNKKR